MLKYKNIQLIILAITLLLGVTTGNAQSPQQRFDDANKLFNQSKFTEAAGIYQQLLNEGHQQKAVWFNAGNAWYKAGKTGMAVYAYEKALQLAPGDAAVQHNLGLANQKVNGYIGELPLVFFQQWWLQLQHLHKPNGWATGAIIFLWLLVAAVVVNTWLPGWKNKFLRWGAYALGVLFALYLMMAIDTYRISNNHQQGIVMNNNIRAKTAPDENSKDAFEVGEGTKVHITDSTQDFCKIELADGKNGWISCSNIKRL
ncbi:tetratricopeptide repeat protein [Chitinophaga sp. 212800010-3]|uniref:tetratricopeptide repeat protein n=1 Tax=unclassified Chitinophaga TaxID=2619133 RepID=UPI002DE64848|nr:SH3b domain-containing protein [Chitinophaga sp. 212800010-3]